MFLTLHRTLSSCTPWLPYFQQCERNHFYLPLIPDFDRHIEIHSCLLLGLVSSPHHSTHTIDLVLFKSGGRSDEGSLLLWVIYEGVVYVLELVA